MNGKLDSRVLDLFSDRGGFSASQTEASEEKSKVHERIAI